MARGNKIVVNADARGAHEWGYLGGAYSPGVILQIDTSVALKGGKHTWVLYNQDADGDRPAGPFAVLNYDYLQGKGPTDAYSSGVLAPLYVPLPGDELNLLFMNVSGTGDDVPNGTKMIVDDGTGKITNTTGGPETEVAVALEAITDPTADQLLWVRWSGY